MGTLVCNSQCKLSLSDQLQESAEGGDLECIIAKGRMGYINLKHENVS